MLGHIKYFDDCDLLKCDFCCLWQRLESESVVCFVVNVVCCLFLKCRFAVFSQRSLQGPLRGRGEIHQKRSSPFDSKSGFQTSPKNDKKSKPQYITL